MFLLDYVAGVIDKIYDEVDWAETGKHLIEIGFERGFKNIDLTKFRDDIDVQKMMNIINWTMLSFAEQQRDKVNSFEDISLDALTEWDEYSHIMKRCFYKEEEQ